jgi:site-specific DNA-methyltransferase (adenine-specific)/site-specific DNA-methyltransferase (cytosine-N4-specific)
MNNYIGGNIIGNHPLSSIMEDMPNSTCDLILFRHDPKRSPVKESRYSSWLFDQSKLMMRALKSTGSLIVVMKENVLKGKRNPYVLEYLQKMSDYDYWTETFIWHRTNPHPTGNKKRLKDGFEYCYQFTRSKDYKFFPDQCLVSAKNTWSMGEESSHLTRPPNLVSFASKGHDLPIGLSEFFINLTTEKNDLVFMPFLNEGNEVIACLNTGREYFGVSVSSDKAEFAEQRVATWKEENIRIGQTIFG